MTCHDFTCCLQVPYVTTHANNETTTVLYANQEGLYAAEEMNAGESGISKALCAFRC